MAALWNVAVVLGLALVSGAAAWGLLRWDARRDRDRAAAMGYDRFACLPPAQRDAYLRHPMHRERCWCGVYGLPWVLQGGAVVLAEDGVHESGRCYPEREWLG